MHHNKLQAHTSNENVTSNEQPQQSAPAAAAHCPLSREASLKKGSDGKCPQICYTIFPPLKMWEQHVLLLT